MSANGHCCLAAEGVSTGYGGVQIVHEVSIRIEDGEIVTIIGPNGAGKSTLLKAIFGLLPAWEGRIVFQNADVTGLSPNALVARGIGFVPQTDNVFPNLTIHENLEMGGFQRQEGLSARIDWIYDVFPVLAERPNEKAGRLSGGQRQMLALGRALMLEPKLLLLDEPSASLSPALVETVFEKIIEINALGTAMLLVEQNARHALQISHRGYILATGEKRLEGDAQSLLESDDVRRLYLGE